MVLQDHKGNLTGELQTSKGNEALLKLYSCQTRPLLSVQNPPGTCHKLQSLLSTEKAKEIQLIWVDDDCTTPLLPSAAEPRDISKDFKGKSCSHAAGQASTALRPREIWLLKSLLHQ